MHIAPATRSYINRRIVWGIGIFFITMLAAILIYSFAQLSTVSNEQGDISKTLSKVDYSKLFSNTWVNIFMGVNVLLGLILLDVYLTNKRKEFKGRSV